MIVVRHPQFSGIALIASKAGWISASCSGLSNVSGTERSWGLAEFSRRATLSG
jgi:hypothetical protein